MNKRSKSIFLSGCIVLAATIMVSMLCIKDWSGLTGLAFSTMLLAEIVFFAGFISVEWIAEKTEQVIARSAVYTLVCAYAAANILVSILYIVFFKEKVTSFAVIQVVLLAAAAIAVIVSLTAGKSIYESNDNTMKAVINVEALIERLNQLAVSPACTDFSSSLRKLSDDLRFTDISKSVQEDADISDVISAIEIESGHSSEHTFETIKTALIRLNSLIEQRKLTVSASKKGKI